MKNKLAIDHLDVLELLRVNKHNRTYQEWKREPLSIELVTDKTFNAKTELCS